MEPALDALEPWADPIWVLTPEPKLLSNHCLYFRAEALELNFSFMR